MPHKPQTFQSRLTSLQGNLLNFAYMLTSNRDDAYDLVQDTTLKALDNSEKYTENTNLKGWLFTIMRNLFINNYRRDVRTIPVDDNLGEACRITAVALSDSTPEGTVSVREINDAIRRLDDDCRRPFELHVRGYKYVEISQMLSLPLGTVKSRIFAARRTLQVRFAQYR